MTRVVIYYSDRYDLVSYGNGLAYAVHDNKAKISAFIQGDDASTFREEFDAFPDELPLDDFCAEQIALRE